LTDRLNSALADRYRIERELGAGGMATVYLAHDARHDRKVALKVLRPELAAILGAERFLQEIKVTANLQHPNILALYDSGEADTFLYYVMPFVEGETLRDRLDREKQLSVEDAVAIAREIGAALQFAHERKVVHRDIKPENILFQGGQAIVADFGIALAVSQAGGARLTETGLSLGTPHYMSPEQATGDRELDARSDIYSLGAVVYEMLTGEPPHSGKSVQAIVAKILSERPSPISQTRDLVPPNVDAAVQKALAKSPADRFPTAARFTDALTNPQFTLTVGTAARAAVPPVRRSAAVPILAATTVLATAAAFWFALRPVEQPVSRFSLALPTNEALGATGGPRVALSPDGRRMVYVAAADGINRLMIREWDQLHATPLPGTEGATTPTFSPDGQRIAFLGTGPFRLQVVATNGAPPITLADSAVSGGGTAWGPDDWIYFDAGDGLERIKAGGGPREVVVALDTAAREVGVAWPEALPNGRGVLYRLRHAGEDERQYTLMVTDLRSGERRALVRAVMGRYAASGHLLYVTADGKLLAAPFDPNQLELTGPATPLVEGVGVGFFGSVDLGVSRKGTAVYTSGAPRVGARFVWRGRDGATQPVDPNWTGEFFVDALALSPDGKQLAFSAINTTGGSGSAIWIKQLDAGPVSRLTFDAPARRPTWTPDSRSVLFAAQPDPTAVERSQAALREAIYRKRADGTGSTELLARESRGIVEVTASPDGRSLVMRTNSGETGGGDLLTMRLGVDSGPSPLLATRFGEFDPAVSPDGRWLAYVSNESGSDQVYVRPYPNVAEARWQVSANGGYAPRWAHSGRELFYVSRAEGRVGDLIAVQVQTTPTFAAGRAQTLFSFSGLGQDLYDVAPGDRRFLTIESAGATATGVGELILVQNLFVELKAKVAR
jgi:serine/threonine-protein kinase